uniref:PDZ domain-containing protein n=1 Tax=Chelydra serpentina TaxID=8475 RepID=A0A8C3SK27_CHESE
MDRGQKEAEQRWGLGGRDEWEVESGASGFSVTGGGNEGIFVKQVLKGSSASKIFSLREGDQLLSATIFFDNIKYEDALKILQYSEPYKVQFSLKRKLVGKEDLEKIHSTAEVDIQGPEATAKAARGMKIHMPKVKMPSMGFSKPEIKAPKVDVDVTLPKVDVTLPTCDVRIDVKAPSAEIVVEGPEVKAAGLEGKIKMPKFEKPKFGVTLPKGKVPEGEISLPKMVADVPKPKVKGQVDAIGVETSTFAVEVDVPDVETEASGWKIQMPSLKMPKMPKADIQAPEVDITLPSVDVSLPKGEMDTKGPEATAKGVKIESEIKATDEDAKGKESKFKMPTFGMPSFGWSTTKGTSYGVADVEANSVKGVSKMPHFKIPKLSISKFPKSEISNSKLQSDVFHPITESNVIAEGVPLSFSDPESSVDFPEDGGDARAKSVNLPKFWIPDLGFSKVHVSTAKVDQDANLLKDDTDIKFAMTESSTVLKSPEIVAKIPSADIAIDKGEVKLEGFEGKTKMPKFQKMKFGISLPKGKIPESEISLPQMEADIPKPKAIAEVTEIAIEASTLDVKCEVSDAGTEVLPSVDVTMPTTKVDIQGPDLESKMVKIESEIKSGEKDTDGKESKFKMPKFKLPSFSWSPKKEAVVTCDTEAILEEPTLASSLGETEAELTLTVAEVQCPSVDLESDMPIGKDGEKGKIKKPQFSMPKISLPKMKGHKAQVSLPKLESDVSGPKPENEGDVSVQISEKGSSGDGEGIVLKMPKVKISTSEFSKPEIKAPKMDVDINLPTVDVTLPTYDMTIQQADLKLRSAGVDVRISAGIAVEGAKMKVEGLEGKIKMPEFQKPKFGISRPKGKVPESEISLPKMEADVPQLKAMTDIADIAVEAPTVEVESAISNAQTESSDWKIKMPKIPEADIKTPKVDINLQSNVSVPMAEIGIQDSNMASKATKVEGEIKPGDTEMEGKEGHFKLPKFKLPSFSWSPKKEASIKADFEAPREEPKITVSSGKTDTKLAEIVTEDQGPSMDLDIEISTGKEEQKSQIKKPQFIMPKISFSKIKAPKSQVNLPKVEADITVPKPERDGEDLVQIPDIESSHTKSIEEGAQISIKMPKVQIPTLEFSKPEIKVPKSDMGISLPKVDATFPTYDASLQQADLKSESAGDDVRLSRGIKFPTAEASIELKSPETGIEGPLASYTEYKYEVSEDEVHQPKLSDENLGVAIQKTDTSEFKLSGKPQSETDESNDVVSSSVSLPKLKTFTVEVQPSSKLGDTQSDKQPEKIAVSPLSEDDELAKIPEDEEKDMKDQKEKTDSKRSGRFKFWLPSIGFSSSVDDTGLDSKPEVQKSVPEETQPVDSSASDTDSSKQTEKTGWFRFPKLGFSSPSKKAKNIDKEEETNLKEMKTSDDESPSEKPETFFDAEESLSPKEETIKGEEKETTGTSSNVQVSGAIVTSSARTELILMEKERASQQSILEKTTK